MARPPRPPGACGRGTAMSACAAAAQSLGWTYAICPSRARCRVSGPTSSSRRPWLPRRHSTVSSSTWDCQSGGVSGDACKITSCDWASTRRTGIREGSSRVVGARSGHPRSTTRPCAACSPTRARWPRSSEGSASTRPTAPITDECDGASNALDCRPNTCRARPGRGGRRHPRVPAPRGSVGA